MLYCIGIHSCYVVWIGLKCTDAWCRLKVKLPVISDSTVTFGNKPIATPFLGILYYIVQKF